jgi:hypothetical protein
MVFNKERLAALEKHVTLTIIVHFYFIRWPVTRHLSHNSLTKLSTLHEFSEFQWKALLFTALGTSKSEKGEHNPNR